MGLAMSAAQAKPGIVATFPGTDQGAKLALRLASYANFFPPIGQLQFLLPPGGIAYVIQFNSVPVNGKSVVVGYEVRYDPPKGVDPVLATPAPLGNPQTNSIFPFGLAASSSDIVSVGTSETGSNGPDHAFRYSLVGNTTSDLGALGGADAFSFAYGISNDASTIVGASYVSANLTGPIHAFRIGSDGVMIDLGSLAGASGNSTAFAANGDGSVVVGQTNVPSGNQHGFLWTLTPGSNTGTMTISAATDHLRPRSILPAR
jgi:probable HAF family extracellular repeat protein